MGPPPTRNPFSHHHLLRDEPLPQPAGDVALLFIPPPTPPCLED